MDMIASLRLVPSGGGFGVPRCQAPIELPPANVAGINGGEVAHDIRSNCTR